MDIFLTIIALVLFLFLLLCLEIKETIRHDHWAIALILSLISFSLLAFALYNLWMSWVYSVWISGLSIGS